MVDFHRAGKRFSDWMRWNHVMMDGRVLPQLRDTFRTVTETVHEAYSGLWSYFAFVGKKEGDPERDLRRATTGG